MNGDKYRELIKAIDKPVGPAESERRCLQEKFSLLSQMVFLIATNDLDCIEKRQEYLERKISKYMKRALVFGIVLLLGIFLDNPTALKNIIALLTRIF